MTSVANVDGRRERGNRTRRSILEAAAQLASTEGLEGLSIGRLADHVGISKSGLYAHFRSKEQLQLETIRTASEIYVREIVDPAMAQPPGRARLIALCDNFFDYLARGVFPGGCFFVAATLDPARLRGAVRQLLIDEQRELLDLLEQCAAQAQERGEVRTDLTPGDLAYELESFMAGANINFVLLGGETHLQQGRDAVRRRLEK